MDPTAELRERDALLDRIRPHADAVGLIALTMDDAARAGGITTETLRSYFPAKEDLVVALIARNRIKLRTVFSRLDVDLSSDAFRRQMWSFYAETMNDSLLFFEAYALALRDERYDAFLHGVNDWLVLLRDALVRRGISTERADAFATLTLAVYRGAMLDFCATRERGRVNAAMELWFTAAAWLTDPDT